MASLIVGYLPTRIRLVEELVYGHSDTVDVFRAGPYLTVAECSMAASFLATKPLDLGSHGRTVVLNLDNCSPRTAAALLKLVEEPPAGAQIVLVATELWGISAPLQSRCELRLCKPPEYGEALADMRARGLDFSQAARAAQATQTGLAVEDLPRDPEVSLAKACVKAALDSNFAELAQLLPDVTSGVVQEIRSMMLGDRRVQQVLRSLEVSDPIGQAIVLLTGGRRA